MSMLHTSIAVLQRTTTTLQLSEKVVAAQHKYVSTSIAVLQPSKTMGSIKHCCAAAQHHYVPNKHC